MATARFRLMSVALFTSPIPPTPIWAVTSYGPRWVPGVRAKLLRGLLRAERSARTVGPE